MQFKSRYLLKYSFSGAEEKKKKRPFMLEIFEQAKELHYNTHLQHRLAHQWIGIITTALRAEERDTDRPGPDQPGAAAQPQRPEQVAVNCRPTALHMYTVVLSNNLVLYYVPEATH